MLKTLFATLLILMAADQATAQIPDSCLRPWCIDRMQMGEYSECRNEDSVLVDSCEGSSTYLQYYANRWYGLTFVTDYFNLPVNHRDSIVLADWKDIPAGEVRDALENIASNYGDLTLKKRYPDVTDPDKLATRMYLFRYEKYAPVDTVLSLLRNAGMMVDFRSTPAIMLSVEKNGVKIQSVWPNPTDQVLHISPGTISPMVYTIFDVAGRPVRKFEIRDQNQIVLDVSELTVGVYYVSDQFGVTSKFTRE
jgi:hypothetical protein